MKLAVCTLILMLGLLGCSPSKTLDVFGTIPDNHQAILATKVLRLGEQRVSFLLADSHGMVTASRVSVTSYFGNIDTRSSEIHETKIAEFQRWPYGQRGSYTTRMSFDRHGTWLLDIKIIEKDDLSGVQLFVEVLDGYEVVDVGQTAPRSLNKTMRTVDTVDQLTSASVATPELYEMTIADAVVNGKPTMIVFASPAFCSSVTCGPQVATVAELSKRYDECVDFIHVELYGNPHEILGDLSRATLSPLVVEWGLTTDPEWSNESWVFLVGRNGLVKARFEGYTAFKELRLALEAELN